MKTLIFTFGLLLPTLLSAQIISQFTWDSNPITTADVGPNASSVSSSAVSSSGGVGGTNGLNAGLPKADLDFVIPTDATFDVDGIAVSFDFQRDESIGNFFLRGSSLKIQGSNQLKVEYRVSDGAGGFNTITSGNVYSIPNDNTFRNYQFTYDPLSGVGSLLVNSVSVWTNDGPDNRPMYWIGAGDVIIGNGLDGSGANRAFLDNLIIEEFSISPLPIELLEFSASKDYDRNVVNLDWTTASEIDNDFFTIERSYNGTDWLLLEEIQGAGNTATLTTYSTIDFSPLDGTSYYRLKQTDFDGKYTYSDIKAVNVDEMTAPELSVYPIPAKNNIVVVGIDEDEQWSIYTISGTEVSQSTTMQRNGINEIDIDLSNLPIGIYVLRSGNQAVRIIKA